LSPECTTSCLRSLLGVGNQAEPGADHQAACSHAGLCLARNAEIVHRAMPGLRLGPNNAVNTPPIINSYTWCLHAKCSKFHCSFCSSRVQAPFVDPVLLAVVSKLIPITSLDTSHTFSSSNFALA